MIAKLDDLLEWMRMHGVIHASADGVSITLPEVLPVHSDMPNENPLDIESDDSQSLNQDDIDLFGRVVRLPDYRNGIDAQDARADRGNSDDLG
jgi:hypothetical protein